MHDIQTNANRSRHWWKNAPESAGAKAGERRARERKKHAAAGAYTVGVDRRAPTFGQAVVAAVLLAPGVAHAGGLWVDVARAREDAAAARLRAADAAQAGRNDAGARAETERQLREAVRIFPEGFEGQRRLGELLASGGRARSTEALAVLDRARHLAPSRAEEARVWLQVGVLRSRLGLYHEALAAYERQIAVAPLDPVAVGNSAELLMALGRLPEAIERYREAAALEERATDKRARNHQAALTYFGLGVALDRAGRTVAAREAVGRGLALDSGLGSLQPALHAEGDLYLVPAHDVYYYLGLARQVRGQPDESAAAFREYLARAEGSSYAARAREHLERLGEARRPRLPLVPDGDKLRMRVAGEATVAADGPIVAPLIDAAWRLDPALLDRCLEDVALTTKGSASGERRFRLSLALEIDGRGRVVHVRAQVPAELDPALGTCVEDALRARLRLARSAGKKPTKARVEVLLAPADDPGL
jgi:tetratricopeptide (TPR) repeat protein